MEAVESHSSSVDLDRVMQRLVDLEDSMLVIEPNLDGICCGVWVIDLCPVAWKQGLAQHPLQLVDREDCGPA